jgi:hypothetical protein
MGRKRKHRRQPHGSAWHRRQTDCPCYTMPGTKKRVPLFGDDGQRIRGKENREADELALAKEKLSWEDDASEAPGRNRQWLVAGVCSEAGKRTSPPLVRCHVLPKSQLGTGRGPC